MDYKGILFCHNHNIHLEYTVIISENSQDFLLISLFLQFSRMRKRRREKGDMFSFYKFNDVSKVIATF